MADYVEIQKLYEKVREQFAHAVVGQDAVLRLMLAAYFSQGHVLFEGIPGIAKTLMVKTFARILGGEFKRVQFTPDLLPSDIIGTMVYYPSSSTFRLHKGAIFCNFLLADEINRTPPKTQSSLLEAMEERQVSIEGQINSLPADFTVFATQNPIEYEGTYPLPEAQLDRFMMRIKLSYPLESDEFQVLKRYDEGFDPNDLDAAGVENLGFSKRFKEFCDCARKVRVRDEILSYILQIVRATRKREEVSLGASPRAGIFLLKGSKIIACLEGRDYVIPDDVAELVPHVLNHRLILSPEYEIEGRSIDDVIFEVLQSVPVPR